MKLDQKAGRRRNRIFIVLAVGATAMMGAGGYLFSRATDPFRTAAFLDLPAYEASANSLRGNSYQLEGEIVTLLAWSPSGRIVSVALRDTPKVVPILLPHEFNPVSLPKGRTFRFLLVVDDQGVLRAQKLAES